MNKRIMDLTEWVVDWLGDKNHHEFINDIGSLQGEDRIHNTCFINR